jgi:hypothetical protein
VDDVLEIALIGLQLNLDTRKWDQAITVDLQGLYLASLVGEEPAYVLTCAGESAPPPGEGGGEMSIAELVQSMEQATASFVHVSAAICDELSPVLLEEFDAVLTKASVDCKVRALAMCRVRF